MTWYGLMYGVLFWTWVSLLLRRRRRRARGLVDDQAAGVVVDGPIWNPLRGNGGF